MNEKFVAKNHKSIRFYTIDNKEGLLNKKLFLSIALVWISQAVSLWLLFWEKVTENKNKIGSNDYYTHG